MLSNLRNFARTWPGKILGGFMLIGLAGFGITGVLTGTSFNTIAKVGSEDISTVQFQRAYNAQLNNIAQQTGSLPTSEQAMALGIPSQVINQLAVEAALNALGKDFGLGISDERLGSLIRQDPSFGGTLGNFDPENFRSVLQRSGWTEREYFEMQENVAQRQQIVFGLFGGITAPKSATELVSRYGADMRDVEYFVVGDENILPPSEPTASEIAQYLDDNLSAFKTQTLRNVKMMVLTPATIAKTLEVSEQEIVEEYERTKANYIKTETRTISQVLLDSDIYLKRFELGLKSGESFEDLVSQTGLQVTELGAKSKAQILDSVLSEAAFSLNEGEFKIISGLSGKRAIYISKIEAGGQTGLEELRDQISDRLKNKQARELFIDILDNIEEQRAAFKPLDDIARQFKLEIINTSIAQNGDGLDAVPEIPIDAYPKVSSAVFDAKEGALAPSITLSANMNIWFDLISIEPSRDQTIDEVGDEIKALLIEQRIISALANQVNELVAKIKSGEDFATIAVTSQSILAQANGLTRSSSNHVLSPPVIAAIFEGGKGLIGSELNDDGDYVIFHVVDVTAVNEHNNEVNEFVSNSIVDSIYGQFVTGLIEDAELRINQETLSQVLNPQVYGGFN